jgi:hypothetical protein
MSQIILNVLCEGPTEDRFAGSVLKEHLKGFGIVVKTTILVTNKKKNIRGGMLSYQQAKTDLGLLMKQHSHSPKTYEKHFYTTMFDLYALPNDFPGYADAVKIQDCYAVNKKLEDEFRKDINHPLFIPYIQLHEFEALVFCGLEYLLVDYPDMTKQVEDLKKTLKTYDDNPEKINNSPEAAPLKRIIKAFESKHHYDKAKSGVSVTGKIGIFALKEKCRHFREWIDCLEKIS